MEYERYNSKRDAYNKHRKSSSLNKFLIFLSFVFVLGLIYFTAFYDGGSITGKVISSTNQNNSLELKTSLSVPEISLKQEYSEIILSLEDGHFINLDNKKILLDDFENILVLKDFKGSVEFDGKKITKFEGSVSEIILNKFPISLQKGQKIKFSLSEDAEYSFLHIKEGVFFKEFSFVASGKIESEGDILNLNLEKATFKNYFGGLKIEKERLILEGFVERVDIRGSSRQLSLFK